MNLTFEMLHGAIQTYLALAYPDGAPEDVLKNAELDASKDVSEVLRSHPFEQVKVQEPAPAQAHALRLGCDKYRHIKVVVRPFPCPEQFIFWVDTHDRFFSPRPEEKNRWREIVARNNQLKQQVERQWAAHNLPTFVSVMKSSSR